jgi:hypothetical protein
MKKLKSLIIIILLTLSFYNCSSDNNTPEPEPEIPDNIRPPYTVKYEIIFPQNAWSSRNTAIQATYEDNGYWWYPGAVSMVYIRNNVLYQGFTKTFTVTIDRNPLQLSLKTNYNPYERSIVTFKIYVNNVLVKEATRIFNPYSGIDRLDGVDYSVY